MLRRRTFATGLASTLLLAACGQAGVVTPTTAPPVAALPPAGTPATPARPVALATPPSVGSPTGATPARTATPGRLIYGADSAIWQLDLGTGVAKRLSPLSYQADHPALSPDGRSLAYSAMPWRTEPHAESSGQQLWIHTLASDRREVALADTPPETRRGNIAWAPDGRTLLYEFREEATRRNSLRALDLATGQSRLLVADALRPSFSPTGRLAYVTYDNRQKSALWIADVDGRDARQIVGHSADFDIRSPRLSPDGSRVVFSAWHSAATHFCLWIAMADGRGARELSVDPGDDFGPDGPRCNWYPDGQQIVFAGETGIFRLPLAGTGQWSRIGTASHATGLFLIA